MCEKRIAQSPSVTLIVSIIKVIISCILDECVSETVNVNPNMIESVISVIADVTGPAPPERVVHCCNPGAVGGPWRPPPPDLPRSTSCRKRSTVRARRTWAGERCGEIGYNALVRSAGLYPYTCHPPGCGIGVGGSSKTCIACISKFLF